MESNRLPETSDHYVAIRSVRLKDPDAEQRILRRLPPTNRQYRFVGGTEELSPGMLKALNGKHRRHTVAFVATVSENGKEAGIGVSFLAPDAREGVREMSITVADGWDDKGVGTLLAAQMMEFARNLGVRNVYSMSIADNLPMNQMARDLGMSVQADPEDTNGVIYSLVL